MRVIIAGIYVGRGMEFNGRVTLNNDITSDTQQQRRLSVLQ